MEANKILNSDFLDIIFDGRNKDYGAYDLRKTYNKRMTRAMAGTSVILLLLFTGYHFTNKLSAGVQEAISITDVNLAKTPEEVKPEPIIPPKPKPEPIKVETIKVTPPRLVNEDVPDDQKPPENDKIDDARIGLVNQEGVKDVGITAPPEADGDRDIIAVPKKDDVDYNKIFTKVEIESLYPGGAGAWLRFLNKTFRYPQDAEESGIQGAVTVEFIVDMDGNVSDVHAISGPTNGGLREEAVRVILKSGKWEPAVQNGRKVKSYKKQPITFKMVSE